jgi:hypothetical protein
MPPICQPPPCQKRTIASPVAARRELPGRPRDREVFHPRQLDHRLLEVDHVQRRLAVLLDRSGPQLIAARRRDAVEEGSNVGIECHSAGAVITQGVKS